MRISWTKKSILERVARFEGYLVVARQSGDAKEIANWETAIKNAHAIIADNKERAEHRLETIRLRHGQGLDSTKDAK